MREPSILNKLEGGARAEDLIEEAMDNDKSLSELLNGVSSPNPRVKFGSAKILRIMSERNPDTLYSSWDSFVEILESENSILKWTAMDIVANLTRVDSEGRFDGLFSKFYALLHEGSLITAAHVVHGSGIIARAKPELQDKVTSELLKVEKVALPTEECRNILIGHTMKAFDAYCDQIKDRGQIVAFVRRQLNNSRKSTRVKAEKLLSKLENL